MTRFENLKLHYTFYLHFFSSFSKYKSFFQRAPILALELFFLFSSHEDGYM